MPFYGDPSDTISLIKQLKDQTVYSDIEIIVADDCSPTRFPENSGVTVVYRDENGGFGANVNSGVDIAQGKWLFILNSDLSVQDNFIEEALKKAESLGDVLLAPEIIGHDGKSQYVGRRFPTTFHIAWEWLTPLARFKHTNFWHRMVGHDLRCVTGATVVTDWLMGACMIMQVDTYRKIGGMDERYFMNSEEVDLQLRLKRAGIQRVFSGDLVVKHAGGASSGNSIQRRQWVVNSRFKYAKKWDKLHNLEFSLKIVTYCNYIFNVMRSMRNNVVSPGAIKDQEIGIIMEGVRNA
ncbi:glycosyltransferase family 2 protein [Rothia sp. ZJ932]|nr:glycosyltransferase family 2 protein [Rothia sp. ZJ932]